MSVADIIVLLMVPNGNDNSGENMQNSVRGDCSEGSSKNANNRRDLEGVSEPWSLS